MCTRVSIAICLCLVTCYDGVYSKINNCVMFEHDYELQTNKVAIKVTIVVTLVTIKVA